VLYNSEVEQTKDAAQQSACKVMFVTKQTKLL